MDALLEHFHTTYRRNVGEFDSKVTPIQIGYDERNKPQNAFLLKPYMGRSTRQVTKQKQKRPIISVAAGFERRNLQGVQVALELMSYLAKGCNVNEKWCNYDYYVRPDASHIRSYRTADRTLMRSSETFYQDRIISHDVKRENIVLSITISKLGAVVTPLQANPSQKRSNYDVEGKYMEKLTRYNHYAHGIYSDYHGKAANYHSALHAHAPAFNVALEKGAKNRDPYAYRDDQVQPIFKNFALGLFDLVEYAVQQHHSYNRVHNNNQ